MINMNNTKPVQATEPSPLQKSVLKTMLHAGPSATWSAVDLQHRGVGSTTGGVGVALKGLIKRDFVDQVSRASKNKSAKYKLTSLGIKYAKDL